MTGHLVGFTSGMNESLGIAAFRGDFAGHGTATARFIQDPTEAGQPSLFEVMSVVYRFESSSAAPTPEPATLGLVGAGLVFASRRIRWGR